MPGDPRQPVIKRQQVQVWQQSGNDPVIPKHAAGSESLMPGQWVSVDG